VQLFCYEVLMPARGNSLEFHHRPTPRPEYFLLALVEFFSLAHLMTISKCRRSPYVWDRIVVPSHQYLPILSDGFLAVHTRH